MIGWAPDLLDFMATVSVLLYRKMEVKHFQCVWLIVIPWIPNAGSRTLSKNWAPRFSFFFFFPRLASLFKKNSRKLKRASGQLNFAHEKCKRRQGRTKFGRIEGWFKSTTGPFHVNWSSRNAFENQHFKIEISHFAATFQLTFSLCGITQNWLRLSLW